ncbi:chromosome segregation protein SMC [Halorhodospira halophila]|uniref:chromosome segregation protein SMC n=1 Tax=Halorhodospira halophila TaxID=1053 RepID=UPI0019120BB9|nr:chromosome segregation protein SMC [Halorhodospira halophila]MBK5944201.1 chromosome segregation protein SMC [Halorhodospira halophila]
MHLKRIKLAGFKSFVDPTSVPLPGRMVGVVGPNGCGKSNIIDAVRWVMGESSAKHLRGESMSDVIFSGSSARSPVGKASIELIFDNSDGAIGGQYAAYNEISVKRQVNREGQSQYALNGTRCRRRDISDVFMGTGLRPRGYTIIEQGMISRVIESRPEELRVYLEEAAGISVYKERRRETERRIRDTRENLERLEDVRDEVHKQLEKLRRQAETAERYRSYKAEERRLRGELSLLRLRDLDQRIAERDASIREQENQRESAVAEQRRAEREIEALRESARERHEALNTIQGRYYEIGAEIASVDERIQSARDLRRRREEELAEARRALEELDATVTADRDKRAVLEERVEELEPALEAASEEEQVAESAQEDARGRLDAWRDEADAVRAEQTSAQRREEVERTRHDAAARRVRELDERIEALDDERDSVDLHALESAISELESEEEQLSAELEDLQQRRDAAAEELETRAAERDEAARELEAAREAVSGTRARLTSLETLQESALGRRGDDRHAWLERRGWARAPRLAETVRVDADWQRAVEAILGDALQAVCIEPESLPSEGAPDGGPLTLVGEAQLLPAPAEDRLAAHVHGSEAARELLAGIRCAPDAATAEALRPELAAGETVVTPDGVWMGANWVRLPGQEDAESGVLEREQEIQALREEVENAEARVQEAEGRLADARGGAAEAERRRDELAAELGPLHRRHADLQARLEHRRESLEQARKRREELSGERSRLVEQRDAASEEQEEAAAAAEEAAAAAATAAERAAEVEAQQQDQREQLERAGERLREARERRYDLAGKLESARTALESVREQLRRSEEQRERYDRRRAELETALGDDEDPVAELTEKRETLLARRSEAEAQLTEARSEAEHLDHQLREQEQARAEAEQRAEQLREGLEGLRLETGELRVHRSHEADALAELGESEAEVAERLAADATVAAWEQALEQVSERIRRLGSVNLAAIDECQQLEERRGYLDEQHADLNEALETLETAIRRIDRETRARFRETFDQVNEGLGRFFPRLFGGGRAYLELTDDDLLSTGVVVMAQPPGKRVSSIHLLSGGEKALSAVALVFAIFNLNPAPFCLLDEVDAPLDEANVGRFCDLVEEMSEKVQFVLITHNRTTMERASHLLGVTMNEPGVSRLVAVDVDEALDIAEAG